MLEVINPRLKRQLEILHYLYENKKQYDIEELAKLVQVTKYTIRSDINHINTNFLPLHIEIHPKGHVKLICPEDVGMQYVYRKIMHLSLEIQIFEDMLYNSHQPKDFYTEKFFISESSLRRIIYKWNKFFKRKKLDIFITISPLVSVNGNERVIRKLYYHCLTEKYMGDYKNSFFKKINCMWDVVSHLETLLPINFSYSSHLTLTYYFFVCIQRIKNKYFITQKYTKDSINISDQLYSKLNDDIVLKEQIMYDYHIQLSKKNLLDIIGNADWNLFIGRQLIKEIPNYEERDFSIIDVKDFLLSFYESIDYKSSFFEENGIFIFHFLSLQDSASFFLYNHYREFREFIEKDNPFFLKMFELHLERSSLPNYLKQNDELKNELLYHILIYSGILLEDTPQIAIKKNILILTTFHKSYMYSIKKKIEKEVSDNVLVSTYDSSQPQLDFNYLKKFDIILTNYDHLSSKLKNKIIYIDTQILSGIPEKIKNRLK